MRITQDQLVHLPTGEYEHSLVRLIVPTNEKYSVWTGTLTNNPGASR